MGRRETGGKTTGAKEMGVGETGGNETRVKAMGVRETGGKAMERELARRREGNVTVWWVRGRLITGPR